MIVELAQIDISLGEKETNLSKAISLIEKTDADLFLLPEVFTTGFDYENIENQAERIDGKTVKELLNVSEKKIIAAGIVEKGEQGIYNTLVLIEDGKLKGSYRKIHLFQREKNFFNEGNEVAVIDTEYGKIGLSICYDLRFPELYRELMGKKAVICLTCANFPAQRSEHFRNLAIARSIENQFFMLACNRVGKDRYNDYSGNSLIVNPWGDVLAEAKDKEEVLSCEIDLGEVEKVRQEFPVHKDIRLR